MRLTGQPLREDHVRIGILIGTLTAALLATVVLRLRNRTYRRIAEEEPAMPTTTVSPTSTSRKTETETPPHPGSDIQQQAQQNSVGQSEYRADHRAPQSGATTVVLVNG